MNSSRISSSFRDPSGFLFRHQGQLLRQVNHYHKEDYELLNSCGLYENLVKKGYLLAHEECDIGFKQSEEAYKIIKPQPVLFISYPYEWCFSQLQDAALLTLAIQREALRHGMSLKDSSAYNVQFVHGKPVLIDTLSFEKYKEGEPWLAYRQFCQHFLAPLALMSYVDVRLNRLSQLYIDGIPLDLTNRLLPFRSRLNPHIFLHIYCHANYADKFTGKEGKADKRKVTRTGLLGLIDSLEAAVKHLKIRNKESSWSNYYEDNSYSSQAFKHKKESVEGFLRAVKPTTLWDLGANRGVFSDLAAQCSQNVVAFDTDAACVEAYYLTCRKNKTANILPLVLDLATPSPAIGWANSERMTLAERNPADALLALALIHHLAIGNNLPFSDIAKYFATLSHYLIIEFVPKDDPQVISMLSLREDIFMQYDQKHFESEFSKYFTLKEKISINNSPRVLYLMHRI